MKLNERLCVTRGGGVISVPNNMRVITTYVAEEQGQWFDPATPFLTDVLATAGDVVVDVGAGFGFAALGFAKSVGDGGRVVAFEPSPATARHLRRTAALNGLAGVIEVHESALDGTVTCVAAAAAAASGGGGAKAAERRRFFDCVGGSPELACLSEGGEDEVAVVSLDDLMHAANEAATPGVGDAALLHVSCAGAELDVLRGAGRLLAAADPVVAWTAGEDRAEVELLLTGKGFDTYTLLPCGVLVPHVGHQRPAITLFSAKRARAAELAARGVLCLKEDVEAAPVAPPPPLSDVSRLYSHLLSLPYAKSVGKRWVDEPIIGEAMRNGLWRFCLSRASAGADPCTRVRLLEAARDDFKAACGLKPTVGRMSSYARCVYELGGSDVEFLVTLSTALNTLEAAREGREGAGVAGDVHLRKEPFLTCLPEFEDEECSAGTVESFFEASARLAFVRQSHHTLLFAGAEATAQMLEHLEAVVRSGFFLDQATPRFSSTYKLHKCNARSAAVAALRATAVPAFAREKLGVRDRTVTSADGARLGGYYPQHDVSLYGVDRASVEGKRVAVVGTYEGFWVAEVLKLGAAEVKVVGFSHEVDWEMLDSVVAEVNAAKVAVHKVPLENARGVTSDSVGKWDVVLCMDEFRRSRNQQHLLDTLRDVAQQRLHFTAALHPDAEHAVIHVCASGEHRPSAPALQTMLHNAGFNDNKMQRMPDSCTAALICA